MKTYNVLWVDDEYNKINSFITNAEQEGIIISAFDTAKAGIEAYKRDLNKWDGVILDAKCWNESSNEVADTSALYEFLAVITEFKYQHPVPHFVYTGQPDLNSNEYFEKSLRGCPLYKKGLDEEQLFADIKYEANNMIETHIKHKYSDVLNLFPEKNRLIKLLVAIDMNEINNPSYFNDIRKILESLMDLCREKKLIPIECKRLSRCKDYLCEEKMLSDVPLYIQRSIHACVDISQEGSHKRSIDDAVLSGEAPYLLRSTVMELLNILFWCNQYKK